jgi:hypothetical protein
MQFPHFFVIPAYGYACVGRDHGIVNSLYRFVIRPNPSHLEMFAQNVRSVLINKTWRLSFKL